MKQILDDFGLSGSCGKPIKFDRFVGNHHVPIIKTSGRPGPEGC